MSQKSLTEVHAQKTYVENNTVGTTCPSGGKYKIFHDPTIDPSGLIFYVVDEV
jgi:hypothetical protein